MSDEKKKLLYVRLDAVGDNVLALPFLQHFKTLLPNYEITVLCRKGIGDLYKASPYISEIMEIQVEGVGYPQEKLEILQRDLEARKFDLAVNFTRSSTPLIHYLTLAGNPKEAWGLNGDSCNIQPEHQVYYQSRYSRLFPIKLDTTCETVNYESILKELGIASGFQPSMWIDERDKKFAEDVFKLHDANSSEYVALFEGQDPFKSLDPYVEVLSEILRTAKLKPLFLGSPRFANTARKISALTDSAIDLSGKTSLGQASALLSKVRMTIGADTGLAHVACAVGTPNVVLLGGGHIGRFFPYSPLTSLVCLPLACYGCGWNCSLKSFPCTTQIESEVLKKAVFETLDNPSSELRVFLQTKPPRGLPQVSADSSVLQGAFSDRNVRYIFADRELSEPNKAAISLI